MIKTGYNLESKDKAMMLAIRNYCQKYSSCDGCIFDKSDGCGCYILEIKNNLANKTFISSSEIERQIDNYKLEVVDNNDFND